MVQNKETKYSRKIMEILAMKFSKCVYVSINT